MGNRVHDNTITWTCVSTSLPASTPPPGGAHVINHAGSIFLWGVGSQDDISTQTGPSALWMSDVGDVNSWNPLNQAIVGYGDGQIAMGGISMSIAEAGIPPYGALVLFKNFSTYQMLGTFGASNFELVAARTSMGCVAPRSIQYVYGIGIFRMTHLGIAIFDGTRDTLISDPIRPYIFGGEEDIIPVDWTQIGTCWGSISVNPPMYMIACPLPGTNGQLSRIFLYDILLKAWSVVDLASNISCLTQVLSEGNQPTLYMGGASDGAVRTWFTGQTNWDQNFSNVPISWSFETPEIYVNPSQRMYFKWGFIRTRELPASLSCTVFLGLDNQNVSNPNIPSYPFGSKLISGQYQFNINRKAYSAYAKISGTGFTRINAIDWHVLPQPAGTVGKRQ